MSSIVKNSPQRRFWLALAITPLLTPLVSFPVYVSYYEIMGYNRPGLSWLGFLMFSYIFGVPLGYVSIGTLGWFWVAKLRTWHKLTVGNVCGGACVIGMGAFTAFLFLVSSSYQKVIENVLQNLWIGLVGGLFSGLIFCVIARIPLRGTY